MRKFRNLWGRLIAPLLTVLCIALAFTLSPGLRAGAQSWVGGFLRDTSGYVLVNCTNCGTTSGVQTLTAGDTSVTVAGTATNPTVAVNQANQFNLSAVLTDTAQVEAVGGGGANACAGTNYPATAVGWCAGGNQGTNFIGAVFGPTKTTFNCVASCTVGDSQRLAFFDSNASGAGGRECDFWKLQASATLESGCGFIAAGSPGLQTSVLRNQVANDWNGTCASVATGPHCVTAVRSGQTETGQTCFQLDITNHSLAVDTGVSLNNGAAYTFVSTIPNGFIGTVSTAPTTADSVTWFCLKP